MPVPFDVRVVTSLEDFKTLEDVQRDAWAMADIDIMPLHSFRTFAHNGGVTLAAFLPDGGIAGFVLGLPGFSEAYTAIQGMPSYHVSFMMGVRRRWQVHGVGTALKTAQRDHVLAQGLRLVVWTYDPLLALNAHLNIRRLGAVVRRYTRNLYGAMTGINAGLESDRFEVEWWIASRRVARAVRGGTQPVPPRELPLLNPVRVNADGLPIPPEGFSRPDAQQVQVEIPADFNAIKAVDMGLASAWRAHSRALFEAALGAGYTVTDFQRDQGRALYTLTHGLDVSRMAGGQDED